MAPAPTEPLKRKDKITSIYRKKDLLNEATQAQANWLLSFRYVSNIIDLFGTSISAVMGMIGRISSAIDPENSLTQLIGLRWLQLALPGSEFFAASNASDFIRIASSAGKGKEGRARKLIYSGLNIVGLLIAINVLLVLGVMGFSLAWTIIPLLGITLNIGMLIRNGYRFNRAKQGLVPTTLLAQLNKKVGLATKDTPRHAFFTLKHTLLKACINIMGLDNKDYQKTLDGDPQYCAFKALQKKGEAPTYDSLLKELRKHFASTCSNEDDHESFIKWINDNATSKDATPEAQLLVKHLAFAIMAEQRGKYEFKRHLFTIQCTLSILFISIGICALLATGLFGLIPLAVTTAFQLVGATLGLGVLGCMAGFGLFTLKDLVSTYKKWNTLRNDFIAKAEKEGMIDPGKTINNAHPSLAKSWQDLKEKERTAKALQITGMSILLIGVLIAATAALPFVGIMALGIAGAVTAVASIVFLIASSRLANQARQEEKRLKDVVAGKNQADTPLQSNENEVAPTTEQQAQTKIDQTAFARLMISDKKEGTTVTVGEEAVTPSVIQTNPLAQQYAKFYTDRISKHDQTESGEVNRFMTQIGKIASSA